jgi:hypothetical protein
MLEDAADLSSRWQSRMKYISDIKKIKTIAIINLICHQWLKEFGLHLGMIFMHFWLISQNGKFVLAPVPIVKDPGLFNP